MSSTIKIKRSNTSGNAPDTNNIVEGELALNTADGVLYSRGGNDIFEVGSNLTNADIDALVVNDSAQINGKLEVSPSTASDTITLGSTTQTGKVTLGQSTQNNTINIGSAATANLRTQTINIGKHAAGNSGQKKIIVGVDTSPSVGGSSTTELQGETTIQQIAPNISLPTGDNNITTITSSGKYAKIAEIAMTQSGEFYNAKFQCFFTSNDTNLPSSEIALSIYCRGVGTGTQNPLIDLTSTANDKYAQSGEPHPEFSIRLESDDNGVMKFHVFARFSVEGLGMEIFIKEQIFSEDVSVGYITTILESDYLTLTGFGNFGETSYATTEARIHTTNSWHWDELFGDDPGIIRTTGTRSPNAIQSIDRTGGFLHYDSDTFTFSHTYNIASSDNSVPITIGNDSSASTTILQGVTKIDQLAPRVITPTGDNSISDVSLNGKHVKIVTVDLGASGETYKVNFEVNYNGSNLSGLGKNVTRHTLVMTSQGIGSVPAVQVTNFSNDVVTNDSYTEIKAKRIADVAGDGSGPVRIDLYLIGKESNNGMNVYVRDEFVAEGASLRNDVTWYESPDETDYLTSTEFANLTGGLITGVTGVGFNTKSNNMDDLFGTTAGIVKTTGGNSTSAISAVSSSHGFLHYDSATETFSHTYDMLPSDPATSITIGDSNGTGVISLGTSKVQQAVNINAGVGILNSSIKQTNISTGQTNGSCDINIGPTDTSVNSLVDILGAVTIAGNKSSNPITIGSTNQAGTITLGRSMATNTINIGAAAMDGLVAQTINIGNNKGVGGSSVIKIGDNGADTGNTQIHIGSTKTSGSQTVQINSETTFSNGDVNIDDNLEVDGTIKGRYDVIMPFTSSTTMSQSDFKGTNSGTKIISMRTTDVTIDADFQPTTADIGKHWTIVNATDTANAYVRLDLGSQYVRLMSGGSQYAGNQIWKIGRGSVAELVCIDTNVNGGGQSTPNFILYGNEVSTV